MIVVMAIEQTVYFSKSSPNKYTYVFKFYCNNVEYMASVSISNHIYIGYLIRISIENTDEK